MFLVPVLGAVTDCVGEGPGCYSAVKVSSNVASLKMDMPLLFRILSVTKPGKY